MQHTKLKEILRRCPSILVNGTLVFIFRMTLWLLSIVFLISGTSFLLDAIFDYDSLVRFIMVNEYFNDDLGIVQLKRIKLVLGAICILIGTLCYASVILARMVKRRNIYISDITLWANNFLEQEIKKEKETEPEIS